MTKPHDVREIYSSAVVHAETRARTADLSATIELTPRGLLITLGRAGKMVHMSSIGYEASLLPGALVGEINRAIDGAFPEAPDDDNVSKHMPRAPGND
jgi:hypothetical protein